MAAPKRKETVLITLTRQLTVGQADELRAWVASLAPRVHLILPAWRWLEIRGVSEAQAQEIRLRVFDVMTGQPSLFAPVVGAGRVSERVMEVS